MINNNLEDPSRNIVNAGMVKSLSSGITMDGQIRGRMSFFPHINPGHIPDIRRIDITLAVETDEVDPSTKARKQMTYMTSVAVRNHALNQ